MMIFDVEVVLTFAFLLSLTRFTAVVEPRSETLYIRSSDTLGSRDSYPCNPFDHYTYLCPSLGGRSKS